MGKKAKSAPVPDPVAISQAQTTSNIATADKTAELNRVNTSDPYGSVQWQQDPTTGQWSQNATLNAQAQAQFDQLQNLQMGAAASLGGSSINLGALPGLQSTYGGNGAIQSSVSPYGSIQDSLGQLGQIQMGIGSNDFSGDRQKVEDALYARSTSRLDPQFQQANTDLQTRLANQGISLNNAAYGNASDMLGRTQNDAYAGARNDAIIGGGAEQTRLWNQEAQQGQFANAAQNQDYAQKLGAGTFTNSAQAQGYGQNLSSAQFANTAQQQDYNQNLERANFNNQARAQGLSEQQAQDQFNLQRYAALAGSSTGMPQGISYTPTQVSPTDVTGAYGLQAAAQQANAAQQNASNNALMSGLFQLGGAALAIPTGGASLAATTAMAKKS